MTNTDVAAKQTALPPDRCCICGEPCKGDPRPGAKVSHWECAMKDMEPTRAILRAKGIIK